MSRTSSADPTNTQRPARFQPRIITVTVEGESPERVYEVGPGRYQTKPQLQDRLAKMDDIVADAQAAKAAPDLDALRQRFERQQDRRIEMAGRVKDALTDVIAQLEA